MIASSKIPIQHRTVSAMWAPPRCAAYGRSFFGPIHKRASRRRNSSRPVTVASSAGGTTGAPATCVELTFFGYATGSSPRSSRTSKGNPRGPLLSATLAPDFDVLENADGIWHENRGGEVVTDEIGDDGLFVDAHETHVQ